MAVARTSSFDGLRPLLVACHCQLFYSLANKLRSFVRSGGVAIRYVLPVVWMTSRLAVVGRMAMRCDAGTESGVYECLVKCRG